MPRLVVAEPQRLLCCWQSHSEQLGLYLGVHQKQLRFFASEGQLVPTPEEDAERLAAKLRELGIDPNTV